MKHPFALALLLAASAAPVPPPRQDAPAYEKSPGAVDERGPQLEEALGSVRRLRTEVTYDLEGEPARSEVEGTGFVIDFEGARCVVSLAHAVSDGAAEVSARLHGAQSPAAWRRRGQRVGERTFIELPGGEVELRPLHRDPDSDLAFFRLPEGAKAPALPFPAGDSDRLRVGDFVYLLGRLEGTDLHVRAGIVSSTGPTERVARVAGARNVFMISAPLAHGDSGSPVLAVRSGRYELVGIAQGRYETAREAGWALRINPVLAALRASLTGPLTSSR